MASIFRRAPGATAALRLPQEQPDVEIKPRQQTFKIRLFFATLFCVCFIWKYVATFDSRASEIIAPMPLDSGLPRVLVNHYSPLTKRRAYLSEQLKNNGFNAAVFLTDFDREKLTPQQLASFEMKPSEAANFLGHIGCLRRSLEERMGAVLVLEDDVELAHNFAASLRRYLEQLPDNWDMLFIGDGNNVPFFGGYHVPWWRRIFSTRNVYLVSNEDTGGPFGLWGTSGATRAMDSYVVNEKSARLIVQEFDRQQDSTSFQKQIGHWANDVIRSLGLRVYWAEPTIVRQGSTTGRYNSMTSD